MSKSIFASTNTSGEQGSQFPHLRFDDVSAGRREVFPLTRHGSSGNTGCALLRSFWLHEGGLSHSSSSVKVEREGWLSRVSVFRVLAFVRPRLAANRKENGGSPHCRDVRFSRLWRASARLPIFFSVASNALSSPGPSSEKIAFIVAACSRNRPVISRLPFGVSATVLTRRSSGHSILVTSSFL